MARFPVFVTLAVLVAFVLALSYCTPADGQLVIPLKGVVTKRPASGMRRLLDDHHDDHHEDHDDDRKDHDDHHEDHDDDHKDHDDHHDDDDHKDHDDSDSDLKKCTKSYKSAVKKCRDKNEKSTCEAKAYKAYKKCRKH
ncbi:hypothetical protein CLOM_g17035 [Closterium sp. NIES-68]|nr:hypothetical protein CLOM_g17034 [Closterium sp. NIES-68]GJP29174.1 hypothetical protein CLOM_g17035 [Closterium sp. NIES-68]GJP75643.1 hypothetical protein CLOP_g6071 [Closterium sp. NIES-67]GJP75644.1 hypothetical protein CLOP_g6072 [Closterium sp. NIES-67]